MGRADRSAGRDVLNARKQNETEKEPIKKRCSSTELYHICQHKNNLQDETELHVDSVVDVDEVVDEVVDDGDAYADSKNDCVSKVE